MASATATAPAIKIIKNSVYGVTGSSGTYGTSSSSAYPYNFPIDFQNDFVYLTSKKPWSKLEPKEASDFIKKMDKFVNDIKHTSSTAIWKIEKQKVRQLKLRKIVDTNTDSDKELIDFLEECKVLHEWENFLGMSNTSGVSGTWGYTGTQST